MAANLLRCLTQEGTATPYRFKGTNINVYSFEEALYHCYHEWKQSVDDLQSDELADWVQHALGLSLVASKMREINTNDGFTTRLLSFLSITDYFAPKQLDLLKRDLLAWEARLEWERLKERADDLLAHNDAERAVPLYRQALGYAENAALLNNLGIALMAQGLYEQAQAALTRATALAPPDVTLLLHLAEAQILQGSYAPAHATLAQAETQLGEETADILYFKGEIQFYQANYLCAAPHYEAAAAKQYDPQFVYRLSDVYVKLRQFDRAANALCAIADKDIYFLQKLAEVHAQANHMPAAIKCIGEALSRNRGDADLWTRLARYHRLDYDLAEANKAANTALGLSPDNPTALLEHARICKAQGRIRDYQTILHKVLNGFKNKYRETAGWEATQ